MRWISMQTAKLDTISVASALSTRAQQETGHCRSPAAPRSHGSFTSLKIGIVM
jgi:hypothetical protein